MKKMLKRMLAPVLAVLTAVCCSIPTFAASIYSSYKIPFGTMRMIAHRGYSSEAPENTLPSFRAAGKSDFWGAECDIQRTADGVWVLMHDDTVDRMTDGTGRVSEMTYAEIAALTVDSGSNVDLYPNTRVPTLEAYLDVCKEYGLHPVIEIKTSVAPAETDELAALLLAREEKEMFVIISFGKELCACMKELMPETPVYYLVSADASQNDIDFALQNHLNGLDMNASVSDTFVETVQNAELDVIVWTVDDKGTAERFYKLGVTAVTTNALTQSRPEGNLFQRLLWELRNLWYRMTQRCRFLVESFKRSC